MELIAIDPEASPPARPRWFTLDEAGTQDRFLAGPAPLCWVVGTDDLEGLVSRSPIDLGEIIAMSRGDLTWKLTIPRDGSLVEGGLVPGFIEWPQGPHPCRQQADLGIRLKSIVLTHPDPHYLTGLLRELHVDQFATVEAGEAGLSFLMETPSGDVRLN